MKPQPRTGDGYRDNEQAKKDVLLDYRMKKFQADFNQIPSNSSVKDIIRNPFRRDKR